MKEQKPSLRCIYDQPAFAECFAAAAGDEEQFAVFRRNPFFNLLWENISEEEGEMWAKKISTQFPHLLEKLGQIRENDRIGAPKTWEYAEIGELSPSTLRFAAIAGELGKRCGNTEGFHIVQIGAGYGGLCRMMHAVSGFETWTLVDLPEQLALARKYLGAYGIDRVMYLTPEELPPGAHYDLVISDMDFSRFNRSCQELFLDRILSQSHFGFLLGHIFPKHYGVVPLSVEELVARFDKKKEFSTWEAQLPSAGNENYSLFWEREKIVMK